MRFLLGTALLCLAGTAQAETQTFTFGGSGTSPYDVKTGGFTITGFNSALGTLTKAVMTTSGTLTATVRATSYAPTVQYNFQSSENVYQSNGPATFGGNGLKGMGTASYTNPNGPNPDFSYVLTLSGSADTSYTTAAQLAPFINTDIAGYFLFDEPGGFLSYNGNFLSYDLVSSTASGSGSITYFYTPLGGALPEPATWAMLIVGAGAVGTTLRRRRARVAKKELGPRPELV